jgi:hypothetical protein
VPTRLRPLGARRSTTTASGSSGRPSGLRSRCSEGPTGPMRGGGPAWSQISFLIVAYLSTGRRAASAADREFFPALKRQAGLRGGPHNSRTALDALLKSMRSHAHTPPRAHNRHFARSVPPSGTSSSPEGGRQIGGREPILRESPSSRIGTAVAALRPVQANSW